MNFSSSGATIEAFVIAGTNTNTIQFIRLSAFNATGTTNWNTISDGLVPVRINGTVKTGANAGNLTPMYMKVTSGTSVIKVGATLRVIKKVF